MIKFIFFSIIGCHSTEILRMSFQMSDFKCSLALLLLLVGLTTFPRGFALPLRADAEGNSSDEAFDQADADGDGQLSLEEFGKAVATEDWVQQHHEIVKEYFQTKDTNQDGQISRDEFPGQASADETDARFMFIFLDQNDDGFLTLEEFESSAGVEDQEQVKAIFNKLDTNSDRQLSKEEFLAIVQGGQEGRRFSSFKSMFVKSSRLQCVYDGPNTILCPTEAPTTEATSREIFYDGFHEIDADGDDQLSLEEVVAYGAKQARTSEAETQRARDSAAFREYFRSVDQNEDGQISLEEFSAALKDEESYDVALAKVWFDVIDENGDQLLSYNETIDHKAQFNGMTYQERNEMAKRPEEREQFDEVDANKDGMIDQDEMLAVVRRALTTIATEEPKTTSPMTTPSIPSADAEQMFHTMDTNGDEEVNQEEVVAYVGKMTNMSEAQQQRALKSPALKDYFRSVDQDGDGQLSLEEFRAAPDDQRNIHLAMLKVWFYVMDTDGNQRVSYDEMIDSIAEQRGLNYQQRNELFQRAEFREQFNEADANGDEMVDLDEFLAISMPRSSSSTSSPPQTSSAGPNSTLPSIDPRMLKEVLEKMFHFMDKDGNGLVSLDETIDFVALVLNMTEEQKEQIRQSELFKQSFLLADKNEDGQLSLEEILNIAFNFENVDQEKMRKFFDAIDVDRDGFLSVQELVDAQAEMLALSEKQKEELLPLLHLAIEKADSDGDGKLSFDEYLESGRGAIDFTKGHQGIGKLRKTMEMMMMKKF